MIKNITSTELKQNLRKILDEVGKSPGQEVVVFTYNEPKVVIMNYELWVEKKEGVKPKIKPSIDELRKYFINSSGKKRDSLKFIKYLRDE